MSTNLRASEPDDLRALVNAILASDQQIQDFHLHVLIRMNGKPFNDVDWGYDRGREFFSGTLYTYDKGMIEDRRHFEIQAFDGERMYSFTDQLVNGKSRRNGLIRSIRNVLFSACPNPRTLLGSDLRSQTRETMGEVISRFANVKVRPEPEMVAGHKCRVLELVGVDPYPEGVVYDALVWIDTERGYRPLRYEKYNDGGEFVRWKLLHARVDNVQLTQIDGIWFPIYGEVQQWGWDYEAAPGFTREDCLREMKNVEDGFAKKMLVVELHPSCLFTVHVDPATIRLNKGVPAERFSINFPDGTAVHDALREIDYIAAGQILSTACPLVARPGNVRCAPTALAFFNPKQDGSDFREISVVAPSADGVKIDHSEISTKSLSLSWRADGKKQICRVALVGQYGPGNWCETIHITATAASTTETIHIPVYLMIHRRS